MFVLVQNHRKTSSLGAEAEFKHVFDIKKFMQIKPLVISRAKQYKLFVSVAERLARRLFVSNDNAKARVRIPALAKPFYSFFHFAVGTI